MKKFERGTIKYLIVLFVMVAVFGLVLYPLFDLAFCKFITRKAFEYSIVDHVVEPIIFACIFSVTYWAIDKKKK